MLVLRFSPFFQRTGARLISSSLADNLNFVNGTRREGRGSPFDVCDPATWSKIGTARNSNQEDINEAVSSATAAYSIWSSKSGKERATAIREAANRIRQNLDTVAEVETQDCGKPLWEAKMDIAGGAECLEYFAGLAPSLHGQHIQLEGGSFAYTRREPLGVCAGIGPWNYPFMTACWKAGPALACGNALIYKPSPLAPLSAVLLARIFADAGLPAGAFNVIQGTAETGTLLARHEDVAKVSFTGSIPTGKTVMATSSGSVKTVTLELGGKSPMIVFEDADLDNAVSGAMMANFLSQGQVCSNGTRVFVHHKVKDAFIDKIVSRVKNLRVGHPMKEDTQVGALISPDHAKKVLNYLQSARDQGADILCGGDVVSPPDGGGGSYISPAVVDGCKDSMKAVQEEVFGPAMFVLGFETEDEVIQRANDSVYGLAAGIFTRDLQRAHRVIASLQAGMCWINNFNIQPSELPFGGYKQSGIGRENGMAALDYYSQLKTVYVEMGNVNSPF
eukprot:m.14363 g.14363  ORF g.14363 m.14363 type:complete len:505 (+) comp25712_c0_seq1:133-1647(+)